MNQSSPLDLGGKQLYEIDANALEAGDILCTYESINPSRSIVQVCLVQEVLRAGANMSNLLHYEIILENYGNGCIRIAHASGKTKTVASEMQNINLFRPGTVVVVISPPDQVLRRKIIEIAKKVVDKGNKWELLPSNNEENSLEKIAKVALHSLDGLYEPGSKKLLSMNCAQFVNHVINSSLICIHQEIEDIITNAELEEEDKTTQVLSKVAQLTKEDTSKLFMEPVTSTLLTRHFFDQKWDVRGYVGKLPDRERYLESNTPFQMPLDWFKGLERMGLGKANQIYALLNELKFFDSAEIADGRNILIFIAFVFLYSEKTHCDIPRLIEKLYSRDYEIHQEFSKALHLYDTFIYEINELQKKTAAQQEGNICDQGASHIYIGKGTKLINKGNLNGIALAVIKKFPKSTAKDKLQDVFFIEQYELQIKIFRDTFSALLMFFLIIVLFCQNYSNAVMPSFLLGASSFCHRKINKSIETWKSDCKSLHRSIQPTIKILLESDAVKEGHYVWINYSPGNDQNWTTIPVDRNAEGKWEVNLCVTGDLRYKFFFSDCDMKTTPPMHGAKWQETHDGRDVLVRKEDWEKISMDRNKLRTLPTCYYPAWYS